MDKRPNHEKRRISGPQGVGPYRARFLRGVKGSDPIFSSPIPQIAFVGRSNVGKSSTINALLGVSGLARTSQTPGKTQEINFFSVGDSIYFVDLPGYGYARMPQKEAESIRKRILWYLSGGEAHPKLLVHIVDGRHKLSSYDQELLALAREEGHPLLVLLNKIDTLNQKERVAMERYYTRSLADVPFVPFSAKTKQGVDEARAILFGA